MPDWLAILHPSDDSIALIDADNERATSEENAAGAPESYRVPVNSLQDRTALPLLSDGRSHRMVLGIPSTMCLCGTIPLAGRRKSATELSYLAEEYLPWSAEDCYFVFHHTIAEYWFTATPMDSIRKILVAMDALGVELIAIVPLPFLAMHGRTQARSPVDTTCTVRLHSNQYGDDEVHQVRNKGSICVTKWTYQPVMREQIERQSVSSSAGEVLEWDVSDCIRAARNMCQSNSGVAVDFLNDPGLAGFKTSVADRELPFALLLLTLSMIVITASAIWTARDFNHEWIQASDESASLLKEVLPNLPEDRRSLMLAKSHRNQLRTWHKAAMQLPKVADPETPLVQLLEAMTRHAEVRIESIRLDETRFEFITEPIGPMSDAISRLQQDLTDRGFQAVTVDADSQRGTARVRLHGQRKTGG